MDRMAVLCLKSLKSKARVLFGKIHNTFAVPQIYQDCNGNGSPRGAHQCVRGQSTVVRMRGEANRGFTRRRMTEINRQCCTATKPRRRRRRRHLSSFHAGNAKLLLASKPNAPLADRLTYLHRWHNSSGWSCSGTRSSERESNFSEVFPNCSDISLFLLNAIIFIISVFA